MHRKHRTSCGERRWGCGLYSLVLKRETTNSIPTEQIMSRASSLSQGDFCPGIMKHEASQPEAAMFSEALEAVRRSIMLPAVMKLFVWSLSMLTRMALKKLPTYQPSLIEGVYKVVIIFFKIIFQLMWGSCVHQRRFSRFHIAHSIPSPPGWFV